MPIRRRGSVDERGQSRISDRMQKPLKIYQLESNTVCSPYRLIYPGEALNRLTDIEVKLFHDFGQQECDDLLGNADIFIIQRMVMVDHLRELIVELNRRGIIVVYDIDDDLLHLDPVSRQARLDAPDSASQVANCIRACQAVQCATEALAASLASVHSEITVLENQLDYVAPLLEKAPETPATPRPTIVAYASGSDHGQDWATIRDAYNRCVADLASKEISVETWIIGDAEIFNSVASPRKRFLPFLRRDDYLGALSQVDISLMPLKDSVFNRSKSDVKYLESASAGATVLASELVYGQTIEDSQTGLLFRNADEFSAAMIRLVTDPTFARTLATNAHRYVAGHRLIHQHVGKWESTYRQWHARRGELLKR
jgi:glycosyltransferase involved in cell wall biosynthesis